MLLICLFFLIICSHRCCFFFLCFFFYKYFLWKGYELSGEIALKNNHYYYYYYYPKFLPTSTHNLYNTCKSAYRPGHSTVTALLKVVNDLFLSLNKGNISVLALLDFSSAFDTIDHTILVHRLHTDFGFTDTVLQWFSSYLTDRTHYVSLCNHCSDFAPVHSGVPQGSVLGLYFSPCILSLCLPLLTHTLSYVIHLLMTYNYRCLLPQIEYMSYFTLCSHV